MHADDGSYLGCRGGTGVCRCLNRRYVATKKPGDISTADFFPADQRYACSFERGSQASSKAHKPLHSIIPIAC